MRQIIKFGFALIISSSAFSANPVEGVYLGLLGKISHVTSSQLNFTFDQTYNGTINYGMVGGGVGFSLGYKINHFRAEGEFLFNINNYGSLNVGSCTLISPKVLGPEGTCPAFIEEHGLGFNGNTMGFYGLANVFYDFISSDPNTNMFPYIGVGLGGAIIKHHALIQSNDQCTSLGTCPLATATVDVSNNGFAAQGIIGLGYFMDDFATFGIDFRYLSTLNFSSNSGSSSASNNKNTFGIATINITGTYALDKGDT